AACGGARRGVVFRGSARRECGNMPDRRTPDQTPHPEKDVKFDFAQGQRAAARSVNSVARRSPTVTASGGRIAGVRQLPVPRLRARAALLTFLRRPRRRPARAPRHEGGENMWKMKEGIVLAASLALLAGPAYAQSGGGAGGSAGSGAGGASSGSSTG